MQPPASCSRMLSPGDKAFHRPYRTLEGCRDYLNAVIGDRYGHFLPELSFVSCRAGLPVGQLLTAIVPRSGIVIVDLAVDRELRGLGIASALLSHAHRSERDDIERRYHAHGDPIEPDGVQAVPEVGLPDRR